MFKEYPPTKGWYNKQEKTITLPNGSTIEFSYLRNTDDVYTYQGREYDFIYIDEATQHEEEVFRTLVASLRTTNPKITPAVLLTGNPGGIGHQWVKRLFVDRNFTDKESPEDYCFVQAKVSDNNAINQSQYIRNLGNLSDGLRKMWLDGDWNVFAGLAFTELRRDVHIINPKELPAHTVYFAGFDYGFSHPCAFVLFAYVDNKKYVVNYFNERGLTPEDIARKTADILQGKVINIYCGHDIWAVRGRSSIYDQLVDAFNKLGVLVTLLRADIDRVQGVAQLRKHFIWEGTANGQPEIYFFRNCEKVFDVVQSMQYDDKRPEDVMKVDADENGFGGDDLYDGTRYGLMGWVSQKYPAQDKTSGQEMIEQIMRKRINKHAMEGWR